MTFLNKLKELREKYEFYTLKKYGVPYLEKKLLKDKNRLLSEMETIKSKLEQINEDLKRIESFKDEYKGEIQ